MSDWQSICVSKELSIKDTIARIEQSSLQIALVVDEKKRLVGTITDGDIRRGLLKGISLDEPSASIMRTNPRVALCFEKRETIKETMRRLGIRHMPLVDKDGYLVGLEILDLLLCPESRSNLVFLMAGGLGTRLRPLTEEVPKPMLRVGDRPIIETILMSFREHGFYRFAFSVNHKAEVITDYFGDGSKWGAEISYLRESIRLGTAGALSLLPERPTESIIVMNGDVLSRVDFGALLDFHRQSGALGTMCVREYEFQVPYGVIRLNGQEILAIEEKPVKKWFVNAGIYVVEPEVLDYVPQNAYYDMTSLFELMVRSGQQTAVFPLREYWLDIGRQRDYERAQVEFTKAFSQ